MRNKENAFSWLNTKQCIEARGLIQIKCELSTSAILYDVTVYFLLYVGIFLDIWYDFL